MSHLWSYPKQRYSWSVSCPIHRCQVTTNSPTSKKMFLYHYIESHKITVTEPLKDCWRPGGSGPGEIDLSDHIKCFI